MRYEEEFLRHLQNIMADVDRRIRRGHARLNLSRAQEEKVCALKIKIIFCTHGTDCRVDNVRQVLLKVSFFRMSNKREGWTG